MDPLLINLYLLCAGLTRGRYSQFIPVMLAVTVDGIDIGVITNQYDAQIIRQVFQDRSRGYPGVIDPDPADRSCKAVEFLRKDTGLQAGNTENLQ